MLQMNSSWLLSFVQCGHVFYALYVDGFLFYAYVWPYAVFCLVVLLGTIHIVRML